MENRSRGMQLSTAFLALSVAFLIAPPADAFFDRLRVGRNIAHHPDHLPGFLPMQDGKYPPIGKSDHYHSAARPPYYENQPPYSIPPFFDGRQPPYSEPRVTYDGPPPSYRAGPPPSPYDAPPPPYGAPPPQYNAAPPPSFESLPPPPFDAPPPPPPYNAPPSPSYNSRPPLPPPYKSSPSRNSPPSMYAPPQYNSPQAPFNQVGYESPPSYNSPPPHHHLPPPPYQQQPAQDHSQPSIQLIFELPKHKNSSLPIPSLESKDIALTSDSNNTTTSSPAGSTEPPLNLQNPSSNVSESSLSLNPSDPAANDTPALAIQDTTQDQIPEESSRRLPFSFPPYSLYNSPPPKTYQKPDWSDFRPDYRPMESNFERAPTNPLFNRTPRNFDFEAFHAPEYRPRSFFEPDLGGMDFDYEKPMPHFAEYEGGASDGPFGGFERRPFEAEPPRIEHHYQYPGDENPFKPYRPYKRHDNYVQNHYNLEPQYQPYEEAVRRHPSIVPPGLDISDEQLDSIIKQAIDVVRQEEAEEQRTDRMDQGYNTQVYNSPYVVPRPDFVTMHQPKRYQLEPYTVEEPAEFDELPPETRELEWTQVDSFPGSAQIDLAESGLRPGVADADDSPPVPDLIGDLERPPPTVTEPTIVDLLETTIMSR